IIDRRSSNLDWMAWALVSPERANIDHTTFRNQLRCIVVQPLACAKVRAEMPVEMDTASLLRSIVLEVSHWHCCVSSCAGGQGGGIRGKCPRSLSALLD